MKFPAPIYAIPEIRNHRIFEFNTDDIPQFIRELNVDGPILVDPKFEKEKEMPI